MSVTENLQVVRARIAEACAASGRTKDAVRLVAVSKRQPDERLREAFEAGHRDFGENYVQEILRKMELLPEARWHMIGHVQTNKAKKLGGAAMVHTVDSAKVGRALARGVPEGARLPVLIEVNVAEEATKAGVAPAQVVPLLEALAALEPLEPLGLMCIPPVGDGRRWFAALRRLVERARASTGLPLPELSMGMSADYEDAIAEGSTLVRVGTAIFGPRS